MLQSKASAASWCAPTVCRFSILDPGAAEEIAEWGKKAFEWGDQCGIAAMGAPYIMQDSKLTETLEWGLHEVFTLNL